MLSCVNLIISVNVNQDVVITENQKIDELCDIMSGTNIKSKTQSAFDMGDLLDSITQESLKEYDLSQLGDFDHGISLILVTKKMAIIQNCHGSIVRGTVIGCSPGVIQDINTDKLEFVRPLLYKAISYDTYNIVLEFLHHK
jgi:hypothetical protein